MAIVTAVLADRNGLARDTCQSEKPVPTPAEHPDMHRRAALRRLGVGSAVTLAGCAGLGSEEEPASVGESVLVGDDTKRVEYVVRRVQALNALGQTNPRNTAGTWAVVSLRVTNRTTGPLEMTPDPFTLVRGDGREFTPSTSVVPYLGSDGRVQARGFSFLTLAPDSPTDAALAFEVSPGDRYTLRIQPLGTFSFADAAEIALGKLGSNDQSATGTERRTVAGTDTPS